MIYLRHVDDIFILWTDSLNSLIDFHNHHLSTELSLEHSHTSINFLLTTISFNNGTLETAIYTNTQITTLTFKDPLTTPNTARKLLSTAWHSDTTEYASRRKSGIYTLRCLKPSSPSKNTLQEEQITLWNRPPKYPERTCFNTKITPPLTPLVITYHPTLEPIRSIIKQLQPIFDGDPILKEIFPEPPLLTFKQPLNFSKLIIRSFTPTQSGTRPCQNNTCKTCRHISTATMINTPQHPWILHMPTTKMVYLIQYTKCPDNYVSETRQSLRSQMNSHRKMIKDKNTLSQRDHSISDLLVLNLKGHTLKKTSLGA
ncbi:uncharacterized protein RBU57_004298 [Macrochelys suwanniensis]